MLMADPINIPEKQASGFTILEIIAVLVIAGVLAGLAIPRITGMLYHGLEMEKTRDQLTGDLRRARAMAQSCAETDGVEVVFNNKAWVVQPATNGCGHSIQREAEDGVSITAPDSELTFLYPAGNLDHDANGYREIDILSGGETVHICVRAKTGSIMRGPCDD